MMKTAWDYKPGTYTLHRKTVVFTDEEMFVIRDHTKKACLAGKSSFLTGGKQGDKIYDYQFTAQKAEAALFRALWGTIDLYHETRQLRDAYPKEGDKGSDVPGYLVDAKGHKMRYGNNRGYDLPVQPTEYHPDHIYYLVLEPGQKDDPDNVMYIAGWAKSCELRLGSGFRGFPGDMYQRPEMELHHSMRPLFETVVREALRREHENHKHR